MPLLVSSSPLVRSGWPVPRPPALSPGAAVLLPALNSSPQCETHCERGGNELAPPSAEHPAVEVFVKCMFLLRRVVSEATYDVSGFKIQRAS